MMQGDSYNLTVEILKADDTVLTPADIFDLEITVGHLRKTYNNKQIIFDSDLEKWYVLLTQEETFRFLPSRVRVQIRVLWNSGDVEGLVLGTFRIDESISKEVL